MAGKRKTFPLWVKWSRLFFEQILTACPVTIWDGIANNHYNDEMRPLLEKVEQYAKRTKVESEVSKYIEGCGWKARMGDRGFPNGGNRVSEQIQNNTFTLRISGLRQEWKNSRLF